MIEIQELSEIVYYVDQPETLVFFDIDNTLLESSQQLGSIPWAEHVMRECEKEGATPQEAGRKMMDDWHNLLPYLRVKPVDPRTPEVVQDLCARGAHVLCLTAREPFAADATCMHLQSIGVELATPISGQQEYSFSSDLPNGFYDRGILYSTLLLKKADLLLQFIQRNHLESYNVLFIDDKAHNLEPVERTLADAGIVCQAFHFTGANDRFALFNPSIAELQYQALPHFLSNEEAAQKLSESAAPAQAN